MHEKISAALGLTTFLASFLPWLEVSVSVTGLGSLGGSSTNAWGAGFLAWFSVLLLIANGAYSAMHTLISHVPAIDRSLVGMVAGVAALAMILLRWVTFPAGNSVATTSAGFGLYLGLVVALATAAVSYRTFRQSDATLQSLKDRLVPPRP
ncbi:hypothetical protein [Streptomyces chartreusis]|uniref:hypothetical protein n=1 Tax=Streptomyces chartreusis TaxID=1969 RepID=UPI003697C3AF